MLFPVCLRWRGGEESTGENVLWGRLTQLSRFFLISLVVSSIDVGKLGEIPKPKQEQRRDAQVE